MVFKGVKKCFEKQNQKNKLHLCSKAFYFRIMKTLYLVRHAKSDWGKAELADIDRPLNARGYSDAHRMSLTLKEKKISPDLIITSPAIRAISTALVFCRTFQVDASKLIINSTLYDSSVKEYLNCISKIDNKFKQVLLFGHNPTITDCAKNLLRSFSEEMPTCSIVGIKSNEVEWNSFVLKKHELLLFDFPKNNSTSKEENL